MLKCRFANHCLLAAIVLLIPASLQSDEIAHWKFENDTSGWEGNEQAILTVKDSALHMSSSGSDPYFSATVDGHAGNHRLVISAKFRGTADIQVFWTTAADPQTSDDKSVKTVVIIF